MIMPLVIVVAGWSFSLLNLIHVINSIDLFDSLLLATAATIFSVRYSIRQRNNGSKKKTISF